MTDTLTKLFGSAARIKLLRLFLFNPNQTFIAAEAASRARVPAKDTQRELNVFKKIGLISRSRGQLARYTLNSNFPYLLALQNLLLNAPVRADEIYERVRHTGIIKLVVVGGVFVGEWEGRVDLLVVGDRIKDEKLRKSIRLLESEIGKEIRYTLLSTDEFFYRLNMNDHLVRDVLDYNHRIVHDRLDIGLE
ncbi:MAG TPA: hypothetical protein VHD31_00015 [Candidatus Paceibacterota bacterium]|nr:hypothetical protein [Candidatus Paceibacterota bacterium]